MFTIRSKNLALNRVVLFLNGYTVEDIAAFSYFKFMIMEKCVEQTYGRKGMPNELKVKDEKATQLLRSIFPN